MKDWILWTKIMILYFIEVTSVIIYDTLFVIIIIIDTWYVITIDIYYVTNDNSDCVIASIFEFIIVIFLIKCIYNLGDIKMRFIFSFVID